MKTHISLARTALLGAGALAFAASASAQQSFENGTFEVLNLIRNATSGGQNPTFEPVTVTETYNSTQRTYVNDTEGFMNGILFTNTRATGSSGSGTYVKFYSVGGNNRPNTVDGFNQWGTTTPTVAPTDASAGPLSNTQTPYTNDYFDVGNIGGQFNPVPRLAEIPAVNVNGSLYLEFRLDINQTGGTQYLSLDQIIIWTHAWQSGQTMGLPLVDSNTANTLAGSSPFLDVQVAANAPLAGEPAYVGIIERARMTTSQTTRAVLLGYAGGSGSDDMFMYVPASAFGGAGPDDLVYVYSHFGRFRGTLNPALHGTPNAAAGTFNATSPSGINQTATFSNDDGFEEWAFVGVGGAVPEPSTYAAIVGVIALGFAGYKRRKTKV